MFCVRENAHIFRVGDDLVAIGCLRSHPRSRTKTLLLLIQKFLNTVAPSLAVVAAYLIGSRGYVYMERRSNADARKIGMAESNVLNMAKEAAGRIVTHPPGIPLG